jgi:hypothetical protein
MVRKAEVVLEYQPLLDAPPASPKALLQQACSNDDTTIGSWLDQWIDQYRANAAKYGPFKDRSVGQLYGKYKNMPCIIAGSGPSLKNNAHLLKDRGPNMPLVSCLHNFHFMEDLEANVDLYVTLDAGEITIDEVCEGGKHPPEHYWELTKNRTLAAYCGTHPKLLEKWQGEILFYNCTIPSEKYIEAVEETDKFFTLVSNGGNVFGSCLYLAKCFLGCNPIAFIGADFSFSYGAGEAGHQFHPWDSKYDRKLGAYTKAVDVYGIPVKTWPSYSNFKAWFEYVSMQVPGCYINCTEGGTLGAYPGGNLRSFEYMDLAQFLDSYNVMRHVKKQIDTPDLSRAERLVVF